MAFGTDDEKVLGFNETYERATHLLCEIHLHKNIDKLKLYGHKRRE